jgi:hypothetical protein
MEQMLDTGLCIPELGVILMLIYPASGTQNPLSLRIGAKVLKPQLFGLPASGGFEAELH